MVQEVQGESHIRRLHGWRAFDYSAQTADGILTERSLWSAVFCQEWAAPSLAEQQHTASLVPAGAAGDRWWALQPPGPSGLLSEQPSGLLSEQPSGIPILNCAPLSHIVPTHRTVFQTQTLSLLILSSAVLVEENLLSSLQAHNLIIKETVSIINNT